MTHYLRWPWRSASLFGCLLALLAGGRPLVALVGEQDPVAVGRRLYREGRLSSGATVTAHVEGDVPLDGALVTCQGCHRRSGMGTSEGGRVAPAVAGRLLFAPDPQRARPAYSEESLARALRTGVDSAGRPLDSLMPRYELATADVAALAAYLRELGSRPSPGVEPETLRLATVIAGDVDAETQQAMLDVLRAFCAERSAQTRLELRRARVPHIPGQALMPYRTWSLDVWRLSGAPGEWRQQLEAHYRESPPFILVSGVASGSWAPMHDFCEAHELPCLLPNTDLPPEDGDDFYTFYFSRGLGLEAEILAAELAHEDSGQGVLQVVDRGDERSAAAAALLDKALGRRGREAERLEVDSGGGLPPGPREGLDPRGRTLVLWLTPATLRALAPGLVGEHGTSTVWLSSTLLGGEWNAVPEGLHSRARLIHLARLPQERDPPLERFRAWARSHGVEGAHETLRAQTYFACLMVADGSKHTARYPFRDYLLDLLDHAAGLTAYLPLYPQGSLGPGQRFLAKGGYVIELSQAREPRWVVP